MDPASLTLTIAGLATLFSACIDAYDKINAYRSFDVDSQLLVTRLQANRTVFKRWGARVGFGTPNHHSRLNDPEVRRDVGNIFLSVSTLLHDKDVQKHIEPSYGKDGHLIGGKSALESDSSSLPNRGKTSWTTKGKWAIRGKLNLEDRIESLEAFNHLLDQLIPDHAELSSSTYGIQRDMGKLFDRFEGRCPIMRRSHFG